MATHLKIGDPVVVVLPKPLDRSTQPIWKYDNEAFIVAKKVYVPGYRRNIAENLYYVELYGAASKMGIPYGFLPDWLIKLEEDEILAL